ncbi:hypothetical protein [Bacillus cereus group sp. N21]|uniref:hypothetical protein n=1 Tax=Bacillus cereus group sp. N21 TaxID=2794591 RepID=UPI0018F4B414|nr:hypothetical protein [Bacillus cereus group sp. N21]MBJ8027261.1 hypothetical protein [Bacillus cereus group sp. N21]
MEFFDEQWLKYLNWCNEKGIERVTTFQGYSDFLTDNYKAPDWRTNTTKEPKKKRRGRPKGSTNKKK